ncbi:MAG: ferrochelatase [Actinomycetia bacterium]|nr:ferrochelatase [Actinomycetes bacterium]
MVATGIVVAQLGGPEDLADVEPFIRSIFADPRLVPLPGGPRTRSAISALVARARAPGVRRRYEAIGSGSPIVATTQQQADALETELGARGHEVIVAVAHRYSRPDTTMAVGAMVEAGVERIVMLPLFPQYSGSTTGSSEAELRRCLTRCRVDLSLTVIRSWCEHPSYLAAQAKLIDEMVADVPEDQLDGALLVFSAHGLPQRFVDRGDPYTEEIEATVAALAERLHRRIENVIAYQSRTGPISWVGPDVRDVISDAAERGCPWLGVVPISFVSDHLETLHELDIELKARAAEGGLHNFHRSRCFDTEPGVGPMLADIVEEYL